MVYLCYFSFVFLFIRLLVALVNYLSFAYLPEAENLNHSPLVSILIPVRNEENNINNLLKQLCNFTYKNLEIIIYNDESTDKTVEIVNGYIKQYPHIKLINSAGLPNGWLGKNHACHQLAKVARGDIYLFLDADVSVNNGLIERALTHIQNYKLNLISIFPKQIFHSLGEKLSVPLMNWILLSLLPLLLIRKSKNPAFSAANGQFMMFKADAYQSLWPHEKCKLNKVEDIAIIKLFKQHALISDTLLGDDDISCRMYNSLNDAIEGFTKNIFQFFGNSIFTTILFGLITTIAPVIIYQYMGLNYSIIYILNILLLRLFVSLASRQSVVQNLILSCIQHFIFLMIIVKGIINFRRKKLLWKGRNIL